MIYCSQCGTQNRDGSKFCSNCAARLAPLSGLICPMCSTANPVERVFCSHCGARLVPLTAGPEADGRVQSPPIKGLSLPTRTTPPPAEGGESADETVTKEKIENWLAQLRASPPQGDESPTPPVDAAAAPPAAGVTPEASMPPAPSEPMPTWVRPAPAEEIVPEAVEPSEPAEKVESLPLAPDSAEELPDWLNEQGAQSRLPEAAVEAAPGIAPSAYEPSEEETELPAWLRHAAEPAPKPEPAAVPEPAAIQLPEETTAPAREPEPGLEPAAEIEPERKVETELEPKIAAEPAPEIEPERKVETELEPKIAAEPAPIAPAMAEEIPAWMKQLKPIEGAAPPAPAETVPAEVGEVGELADWLRPAGTVLKETAAVPGEAGAELELDPLANLRGVLPLAIAVTEPHTVTPVVPSERKDGSQIFEDILTAPAIETASATRRHVRRGLPTIRALIYALLALAVIVPFFVPVNVAGSAFQISGTRAAEFFDTIEALPGDATVLVAFDYDPSVAGEMDLLAQAILRHLVLQHIKIVAVSTLETGPNIARGQLASATTNARDYRYGNQYLNIGFIPGNESGLAQLATQGLPVARRDFEQNRLIGQYPVVSNIKTAGNLALVIELAGSEEPLKNWLEQYQPRVNARIAAGVSAAVEPKARAYRDSQQLVALVSGPVGAAQYEILENQPGAAVLRSAAQSLAQLVLIGVVILGNIAFWIGRLQGRKNK